MLQPQTFGHQGAYQVVSEIGRGGFATVYKAYQGSLDRHVAIKVLRSEVVQDEQGIQRFQREARAAARLGGHPHIVTIYDYGEQDGRVYLVLEYIEGSTLQERLTQPISATEIERITNGVGSALDFAHAHQLVHRDIKPSNVLLSKDGRVVLSDFGIAKLLDAATASTGAVIGTPEYMAPEQVTGAGVDARTDIYALGAMVHRIFTGRPLFEGPLLAVLHKHVHEPPPPMAASGRPIPPGVEEVVQKALAKDPADRYGSAGELAAALSAALRPAILLERAQAALGQGQLDQAERLVGELGPQNEQALYVRHEVLRRRQLIEAQAEVDRSLEAGDWSAALATIERLRLREAREAEIRELVRRADALKAAEEARIEAEQRGAERERLEREAHELAEHEAAARAERERLEREARERGEQEVSSRTERERLEHALREHAEREARARAERERLESEAREQSEQEAAAHAQRERLEGEARARAEQEARARAERERLEHEARERAERETEAQAELERLERQARERAGIEGLTAEQQTVAAVDDAEPETRVTTPQQVPLIAPTHETELPTVASEALRRPISDTRPPLGPPPAEARPARRTIWLVVATLAILLVGTGLLAAAGLIPGIPGGPAPLSTSVAQPATAVPPSTAAPKPTPPPTAPPAAEGATKPGPLGGPTSPPPTAAPPTSVLPTAAPTVVVGPPWMAAARYLHTATLLDGGKLLVAGGREAANALPSAELFDPAADAWSAAGVLAAARYHQSATLLPGGKVLVAGGQSNDTTFLASAELYDPGSNSWSPAGSMATPRSEHTATLLENGKVLVAGGQNTSRAALETTELYDPASNSWSPAAPMADPHSGHAAARLPGGQALVVAGFGTTTQATAERYDPGSNSWSPAGALADGRFGHTATLLAGGQVLVVGGVNSAAGGTYLAKAERYDPGSDGWSEAGAMLAAHSFHTATLLRDGQVLITGGRDAKGSVAAAQRYDPASNAWTEGGGLDVARRQHTAALLRDGRVLVAGGLESGNSLASTELFDPSTNAWSARRQGLSLQMGSQNNSGITGTASLTALGGGLLRVEIKVSGAGAGPQPAHIHDGTCAQLAPGPPKFSLNPVSNGASSSDIDASIEQLISGPHAVHMHKSQEELPVYVACSDIKM